MSSDTQFWLGVLLSLPIGIATSLATPAVQRWFEARSKERVLLRTRRLEAEYAEAVFYQTHNELFTQYLVQVAIKTTLVGAVMAVVSGMFFFAGQLSYAVPENGMGSRIADVIRQGLFAVGQFAALIGSIVIVNICRPALALWTRLRNFPEYAAVVPSEIKIRVAVRQGQESPGAT